MIEHSTELNFESFIIFEMSISRNNALKSIVKEFEKELYLFAYE